MNVEKGDTAIVIACTFPENLGIICEVKEFVGTVRTEGIVCHDAWYVVSNGRPFVINGEHVLECGVADASLRPIPRLPDTESTDEQIVKPVSEQLETV